MSCLIGQKRTGEGRVEELKLEWENRSKNCSSKKDGDREVWLTSERGAFLVI